MALQIPRPSQGVVLGAGAVLSLAFAYLTHAKRRALHTAPVAKRADQVVKVGKHELVDPYFWMRDDKRKHPDVIAHLDKENVYTQAMLRHTEPLQKTLYKEMVSHMKEDDEQFPYRWGNFHYYTRNIKGAQYPVYCRKACTDSSKLAETKEEVILDVNKEAEGHEFFDVADFSMSPDHRAVAYSVDTTGYETYTIFIRDVATGKHIDSIPDTTGGIEWHPNGRAIFYSTQDQAHRPYKLWRHEIGSGAAPTCLITEDDEKFWLSFSVSLSGRFLFIKLKSKVTAEYHFIDLSRDSADSPAQMHLIRKREQDVLYSIAHTGNHFWITTNADDAKNFKLMRTAVDDYSKDKWETVIAHDVAYKIDGVECFRNYVVVWGRKRGLSHVQVLYLQDEKNGKPDAFELQFPEAVYEASRGVQHEFDLPYYRLGYSSLVTPDCVFHFDFASRQLILKQQKEVPGYVPSNYACERITARATDGVEIPMSVVYKKGAKHSSDNKVLLYGYGAYGASIDPEFSFMRIALLDRGVVFIIAHIRGGGEMGRLWYEDGKYLKKKNTFTDFIACARHLLDTKFTTSDKLVISGGSAGGLLMGAVMNMAPELFKAVYTRVPFVDIMATMSDPSIPLTVTEYEEWGNPTEEKYSDYMLSYSPYDNVKAQHYPAILITTGLNDSRVAYWEPMKWAAKLRYYKAQVKDDKPVLLLCKMTQGHGGSTGRYSYLEEKAMEYAFLLDQLAIDK